MGRRKAGINLTQKRKKQLQEYAKELAMFDKLVQTYDDLNLFRTPDRKLDYTCMFRPKPPRWYVDYNYRFSEYLKECLGGRQSL